MKTREELEQEYINSYEYSRGATFMGACLAILALSIMIVSITALMIGIVNLIVK